MYICDSLLVELSDDLYRRLRGYAVSVGDDYFLEQMSSKALDVLGDVKDFEGFVYLQGGGCCCCRKMNGLY